MSNYLRLVLTYYVLRLSYIEVTLAIKVDYKNTISKSRKVESKSNSESDSNFNLNDIRIIPDRESVDLSSSLTSSKSDSSLVPLVHSDSESSKTVSVNVTAASGPESLIIKHDNRQSLAQHKQTEVAAAVTDQKNSINSAPPIGLQNVIGDDTTVAQTTTPIPTSAPSPPHHGPGSSGHHAGKYNDLKYSILRIQAVSQGFNWLKPNQQEGNSVGLGTGWIINTNNRYNEPLIVTNAHVVTDASQIKVQLLVYSSERFPATVRFICHHFDVAILTFSDWSSVKSLFQQSNIQLHPLTLRTVQPYMGSRVIAMGFPLGQDLLKLSAGEVAGNQEVDGNVCIQSTAPISPGNSGGPLLDEDFKVVGINFAKATGSAENVNYVIPSWRVKQTINEFLKDPEGNGSPTTTVTTTLTSSTSSTISSSSSLMSLMEIGNQSPLTRPQWPQNQSPQNQILKRKHYNKHNLFNHKQNPIDPNNPNNDIETSQQKFRNVVKIPSIMMRTTVGSEAIYKLDEDCAEHQGILITSIEQRSFIKDAIPSVEAGNYLIQIDDVKIDKFGQGIKQSHLEDQIHFENFFWMRDSLFGSISLQTCSQGNVKNHTLDLHWRPKYERGIREIAEPTYDRIGFEKFGDITLMPMTLNHINLLMGHNPAITRWLMPGLVETARLLINDVQSGTEAEETLRSGMAVKRINGCLVHTLVDYELFFMPAIARLSECKVDKAKEELIKRQYNPKYNTFESESQQLSMIQKDSDSKQASDVESDPSDKIWSIETDLGSFHAMMFEDVIKQQVKSIIIGGSVFYVGASVSGGVDSIVMRMAQIIPEIKQMLDTFKLSTGHGQGPSNNVTTVQGNGSEGPAPLGAPNAKAAALSASKMRLQNTNLINAANNGKLNDSLNSAAIGNTNSKFASFVQEGSQLKQPLVKFRAGPLLVEKSDDFSGPGGVKGHGRQRYKLVSRDMKEIVM